MITALISSIFSGAVLTHITTLLKLSMNNKQQIEMQKLSIQGAKELQSLKLENAIHTAPYKAEMSLNSPYSQKIRSLSRLIIISSVFFMMVGAFFLVGYIALVTLHKGEVSLARDVLNSIIEPIFEFGMIISGYYFGGSMAKKHLRN